jgi:DNA-binding winged helix-turn-helix (wHTH) protein
MNVYHFGELMLDVGSRQLLHKGIQRHLTPKALQLLHVLLLARPRAVSREEIFEELWPSTFVAATNLPSVVNEIRRALDDDPKKPRFIRTVHSFGYAFIGGVTEAPLRAPIVATLFCEGRSFPLIAGQFVIGRGANADIPVAHETVSRRHARLIVAADEVRIEDLGSSNGTFVDGQRINSSRTVTRDSAIRIARVVASVTPAHAPSTTARVKLPTSSWASA